MLSKIKQVFTKIASNTARITGNPATFILCIFVIFLWSSSGPFFHYSDTWQLIINTSTTIITFLMVFLIQNSQNRDAEAMQIKLDELIRCNDKAHNILLDLEALTIEELDKIKTKYRLLALKSRDELTNTGKDIMFQDIDFSQDLFKKK